MENADIALLLVLVVLLPVFFAMGWFAARIDMKTVLKQAKTVPTGFYSGLDALVDKNTGKAARNLAEVIDQQRGNSQATYDLHLILGKLYRQCGENDKAIAMHKALLESPDTVGEKRERVLYELGLNFKSAGLVDRAEQLFNGLKSGNMAKEANQVLLSIYEQDRDWQQAVDTAQSLSHDEQTYQFEISQFYCEMAQAALFRNSFDEARQYVQAALAANKKCTRANMILGDLEQKQGNAEAAIAAYTAIEKQNHAYLGMVGEKLYDAYQSLGREREGLDVLIGYAKTFPHLDLNGVIYEKSLLLHGEVAANQIIGELVRAKPDLNGVYRLLGVQISGMSPERKADADMIRGVVDRQIQKSVMYRCRYCHFKSKVFFWHCPACNKWETFTPNKIEV